jgi:hypothetical protein
MLVAIDQEGMIAYKKCSWLGLNIAYRCDNYFVILPKLMRGPLLGQTLKYVK